MDYESILNEGIKKLPKSTQSSERFKMPKVHGHVEGNKTIITNFFDIAKAFNRKPENLLKFLQRELASPATEDNKRIIFTRKLSSALINQKIELYAKIYVVCPQCNKPDSELVKEDNTQKIKCLACGAKTPVKSKV
tara:strand:+ start:943 stop:1350 length:408 start_codon:yes stop_codon:yes gene_type:complete